MLQAIGKCYSNYLHKDPIKVKVGTSCGIFIIGDLFAQKCLVKDKNGIDYRKTLFGIVISGTATISLHHYINYIHLLSNSGMFIAKNAPRYQKILLSTGIDQILLSPILNMSFLFTLNLFLSRNISTACSEVENRFIDTQLASYMIWPLAQTLNYLYVPLIYRVLYLNFIGVIWNCTRSYIAYSERDENLIKSDDNDINLQCDKFNEFYDFEDLQPKSVIMTNQQTA